MLAKLVIISTFLSCSVLILSSLLLSATICSASCMANFALFVSISILSIFWVLFWNLIVSSSILVLRSFVIKCHKFISLISKKAINKNTHITGTATITAIALPHHDWLIHCQIASDKAAPAAIINNCIKLTLNGHTGKLRLSHHQFMFFG